MKFYARSKGPLLYADGQTAFLRNGQKISVIVDNRECSSHLIIDPNICASINSYSCLKLETTSDLNREIKIQKGFFQYTIPKYIHLILKEESNNKKHKQEMMFSNYHDVFFNNAAEPVYEFVKFIARGGNAVVNKYALNGKDESKKVALKEFACEQSFKDECRFLKTLQSEYVVDMLDDFASSQSLFYICMEYFEMHLGCVVYSLSASDEKKIGHQLVEAVKYLHQKNVIHGDLKPQNILVDSSLKIKLCDFGAAQYSSDEEKEHMPFCTLWYRAPELYYFEADYDSRIDSFSVGCILYELRHKKVLFEGSTDNAQIDKIAQFFLLQPDFISWQNLMNNSVTQKRKRQPQDEFEEKVLFPLLQIDYRQRLFMSEFEFS